MSDLPFDIDDILNEINKRKEEVEQEINSVSVNVEDIQSKVTEQAAVVDEVETAAEPDEPQVDPEPAEEPAEVPAPESDEAHFSEHELSESYFEDVDKIFSEAENAQAGAEEEGINIFDFAEGAPAIDDTANMKSKRKAKANKKWKKSKKGKILLSIILVLAIALIGSGAVGVYYVNDILNQMTDPDDRDANLQIEEWKGMDELIVHFDDIYEDSYASSYRDMIRKWYYNGDPASSTNILNVLLIGEDTRGNEIKDEGTLADSVIIASVNTETGELFMTSILRDTYAYYETVPGDESTGTYGKINSAMSKGGLAAYINAVERLYKINIDNYVLVNFANFKKIIDTLGGVDIEMTKSEIREINNHPKTYGNVYIDGDAGMKHLNGEQALAYCRIRHLDSDTVRADRQKTVLLSVFNQLKNASVLKLTGAVTNLLPYVKTGFSKSEILSIGEYGLAKGWLGYSVVTHTVPQEESRVGGQGSSFYNTWCWKVDFPKDAQDLQQRIYGKTSITLADNRPNFKTLSAY